MSIADFDFETYSAAGYHMYDGYLRKINTKARSGLGIVGATVYSEHESTEVLCLAYNLKQGDGAQLWVPGMRPPADLFAYLASGGLIEAANSMFEYLIWKNVCVARMGWPPLALRQLRDALVKARAYSLPGKLDTVAKVVGLAQKDKDGTRLLNKFSVPRKPTKKNASLRLRPEDDPEDGARLYGYCLGDIEAESSVSEFCPELDPPELALWLSDQEINLRGVAIDAEGLANCREIIAQAMSKYNGRLATLTGGAVPEATKLPALKKWLATQGLTAEDVKSITKESVKALLKRKDLTAPARHALEIRELIGSAAVKKLHAIHYQLAADGRLHELFAYWGAHTGRFAGRGPQPQNLPNSGPDCRLCSTTDGCGKHYVDMGAGRCPWCGTHTEFSTEVEWCHESVIDALEVMSYKSLDVVERYFGNAVNAVASCLRGLFVAAPGKDFICSDYSAIEAVVQAELTNETWRKEVFNSHGKIYEMSASKITGVPFETMMAHKRDTGSHHPMRKKVGKVAELACFAGETNVLTDSGWKQIVDVQCTDLLHDGVEWVKHKGVVSRGIRLTVTFDGVTVTPDHKFYAGGSRWVTTDSLNESIECRFAAIGTATLLLSGSTTGVWEAYVLSRYGAHVGALTPLTPITLDSVSLPDVTCALKGPLPSQTLSTTSGVLTELTGDDFSTGSPRQSVDAIRLATGSTLSTEVGGLRFTPCGYWIRTNGSSTSAVWTDGITPEPLLTASTMIEGTNQGICGLSLTKSNRATSDKPCGLSMTVGECQQQSSTGGTPLTLLTLTLSSPASEKESHHRVSLRPRMVEVFDIINAGPRSRFVIATDGGVLIAHNSGYGGWINAWKNFGADKFMNDEEIKENILAWRDASPNIVRFWGGQRGALYGLEGAFILAVQNPGKAYAVGVITYQYDLARNVLFCRLPSGRTMKYHGPLLTPTVKYGRATLELSYMGVEATSKAWVRIGTYGGRLFENVCQAVARDVLTHALMNLEAAGYPVVLHVHDEAMSEVPEGWGSVEEFESIMNQMPPWAAGWPIRAKGGWRGKRFGK
ncbi:DNA polymerase [bacterium]|nr:DNA polymerase [bacterium]